MKHAAVGMELERQLQQSLPQGWVRENIWNVRTFLCYPTKNRDKN